jgi:hypothetical protein
MESMATILSFPFLIVSTITTTLSVIPCQNTLRLFKFLCFPP